MTKYAEIIVIIGVLLVIASSVTVFISSIDRSVSGTLFILGLILSGARASLKKKKQSIMNI